MVKRISEDDAEDYRLQDAEERYRVRLERRAMLGGPDAPEPCEECGGKGHVICSDCAAEGMDAIDCFKQCPRCLGVGIQP